MALIAYTFMICFALGLAYASMVREGWKGHLLESALLLAGLVMILLFLDTLFSERLIFYSDRVTKVWRGFGSRTIYYLNAEVGDTYHGMVSIRESDANGRRSWPQIPIFIQDSLFSFKVREELNVIINYMTGGLRWGKGVIKKSTLDKEALDGYIASGIR